LIDRAVSDCGLILLAEPRDTSEHVRYGHLAFLLTFNREGATLQGCYDSVPANGNEIPPDTILVDGSGRALGTLHRHTQPLLAWLQMLVPRNEKLTALSRPTVWLLSHLRLPQGASATADDLTAPRAQTRLLGVRTE
jgi:hypothetical protein